MRSLTMKSEKELEAMYAISKEGEGKSSIDDLYAATQAKASL